MSSLQQSWNALRSRRILVIHRPGSHGFSLLEMLVAMAILAIIIGVLFSSLNQTSKIWLRARDQVGSYQSARLAFERISRNLSQSTLNVHIGYDNPSKPTAYVRQSDLHFVIDRPPVSNFGQGNAIFFQAPIGSTLDEVTYGGLPGMLNSLGYYVTYGKDPGLADFLKPLDNNRFRLMQFQDQAESLDVYTATGKDWYATKIASQSVVLANDVILLLFWPRLSMEEDADGDAITKNYLYDSRLPEAPAPQEKTTNQQPPMVQVTMVALDETAVKRLPAEAAPPGVITEMLEGLFTVPKVEDYQKDLAELERKLSTAHIGYRVFTATVPIRESKWAK